MLEKTLGIVKPDGVAHRKTIEKMIVDSGLTLRVSKKKVLSVETVENFYREHEGKPFYHDLINYMTSGPVVVLLIEGENAINRWRELMGVTDPKKAAPGTIRNLFGTDIGHNAVHGSDGPFSAARETEILLPEI